MPLVVLYAVPVQNLLLDFTLSLSYNSSHVFVCVCAGDRRGQHRVREDLFPAVLREALRGPRGGDLRASGALAALPRLQPARPVLLGPLQTLIHPPGVYCVTWSISSDRDE